MTENINTVVEIDIIREATKGTMIPGKGKIINIVRMSAIGESLLKVATHQNPVGPHLPILQLTLEKKEMTKKGTTKKEIKTLSKIPNIILITLYRSIHPYFQRRNV